MNVVIQLFENLRFRGDRFDVTGNVSRLPNIIRGRASSLRLTANTDAAIFYTNDDFRGRVMFRRGQRNISNLGLSSSGGKLGFGNDIISVRLTPFNLRTRINVITTNDGRFPGGIQNMNALTNYLNDVVNSANSVLRQALIQFAVPAVMTRASDQFFDMSRETLRLTSQPWDAEDSINVYLVNSLNDWDGDALNGQQFNFIGENTIIIDHQPNAANVGNTLAHELGHCLGLRHRNDSANIMFTPGGGNRSTTRIQITEGQTEDIHDNLTQRPSKRKTRIS